MKGYPMSKLVPITRRDTLKRMDRIFRINTRWIDDAYEHEFLFATVVAGHYDPRRIVVLYDGWQGSEKSARTVVAWRQFYRVK